MKKLFLMLLASVLMLSVVSAGAYECGSETTIVGGTVFMQGTDTTIQGADVQVTCQNTTLNAVTDANGHYAVDFDGSDCNFGDTVTVKAQKNDLSGQNSDLVNDANFQ